MQKCRYLWQTEWSITAFLPHPLRMPISLLSWDFDVCVIPGEMFALCLLSTLNSRQLAGEPLTDEQSCLIIQNPDNLIIWTYALPLTNNQLIRVFCSLIPSLTSRSPLKKISKWKTGSPTESIILLGFNCCIYKSFWSGVGCLQVKMRRFSLFYLKFLSRCSLN